MNGSILAGRRVMIVEDEFLIALEISDALEDAGAEVSGPHVTLAAAEHAAREDIADLAILDIDLRGQEVFPAAELLLQRGIPFLFYTGQPEREILRRQFPDVPVCVKPCKPSTLIGHLGRLLPVAA